MSCQKNQSVCTPCAGRSRILIYGLIAVFAFWLRFVVSSSRAIGFDEAWDIFVSRQSSWIELFRAVAATSHPPGFYTLLHFVSALGPAQVFDPLLSVLCGVLAVLFFGKILNLAGCGRMAEYSGMLLCALAQGHIAISVIVRPYALANCLMLISFYYLLRLVKLEFQSRRDSALFAITLFFAVLSHFSAIIFAASLALALASLLVFDRKMREKCAGEFWPLLPALVRRHAAIPICLALCILYLILSSQGGLFVSKSLLSTHDPLQLTPYRYLRAFVYSSPRLLSEFVVSVLRAEYNLFSALPIQSGAGAVLMLSIFAALLVVMAKRSLRDCSAQPRLALAPARYLMYILPICCLVLLLFLSILGKYPFGGELRQQFFIFTFGFLALLCCADALPVRRPFRLALWGVLIALAVVRAVATPLDDSEFGKLVPFKKTSALINAGKAIYAGTWTAFTLYGQNRDWDLVFDKRSDGATVYQLRKGEREARLFMDPEVYFENYAQGDLADRIRVLMQRENLNELYVVGFPLGRMHCKICDKKLAQSKLAEQLGTDLYDVSIERERTKNGEGFALVKRKEPGAAAPS